MKYCDIGLNLFSSQFPDPEKIIREAAEADVECILTGSDNEENHAIVRFLETHTLVYGTCGIHPHNADRLSEAQLAYIRDAQTKDRIVAVGECGLDYDRMFSAKENQLRALEKQIHVAIETGKPMFLHERRAASDMIRVFSAYPELCRRSVIHCFTGDRATLETYLDMGFFIGITGRICDDRRARELREAVKVLPLNRVLIETDAPYLTPRNVPGLARTNLPQNIRFVASELARHMHVEEDILIACCRKNTQRLFGV